MPQNQRKEKRNLEKELDKMTGTNGDSSRMVERIDETNELLEEVKEVMSDKGVEVKNFPEVQKMEITNHPDTRPIKLELDVKHIASMPEVQKVEVVNQIKIPEVKIPAFPKIEFPKPLDTFNLNRPSWLNLEGITEGLKTFIGSLFEKLPSFVYKVEVVKEEDAEPLKVQLTGPDGRFISPDAFKSSGGGRHEMGGLQFPDKVTTKVGSVTRLVDSAGADVSLGSGTQYTEGDTDTTITGTAAMMEVGSNTLQPVQGTVSDGLLVNLGTNNDVAVTSVIPGTGATNLGKAIDSAVGATDTGVLLLAKHTNEDNYLTSAEGDYEVLHVDSRGALHASPEQHITFDAFDATTGWSALGNDTLNLATTTKHIAGTAALTFDKVNGAANTVFAGIQKTITTVNLGNISMHDLLQGSFYIPDITNVSYAFLRLGTDSSNYNEWRIPDTSLTAATFLTGSQSIGDANYSGITGNGWNPASISYIAVGVAFDAETNTLAGIIFDEVSFHTNLHTSASFSAEITSDVNTPNVNINRVGGVSTATNAGVNGNGVLRVTIATDQSVIPVSDNGGSLTVDGTVTSNEGVVATATLANVSSSASSVTLIASNASRKRFMVFNDSTQNLFIKFGATASSSSFTVKVLPDGYYESPSPCYTGVVDGIWSSANGSARTTEL